MNTQWVLGFIEGEGCFSISFIKQKGTRFGYQIKPMFIIKLVDSEKDVLEKIRKFFGDIGNIYSESNKSGRLKGMKNANDSFSFRVSKLGEIKKIRDILKKENFVSKQKREDFSNWSKCIDLFNKKAHLNKGGFFKIAKLREEMHKRKQYNKKTFCELRISVEPCDIYKKSGKIPETCPICNKNLCKFK